MADICNYLGFHFSTNESTGAPPVNNGHRFDAVVQVEWDCADPYSNEIMEDDLYFSNSVQGAKKNLIWLSKVKELALERLQWPSNTTLYINLEKVMDGIVSCYITKQQYSTKLFHLVIDNYIKQMHRNQYMSHPLTIPCNCIYNDHFDKLV